MVSSFKDGISFYSSLLKIIRCISSHNNFGLVARKPVFGVSDKASFKPVSSATATTQKVEILPVASLHMILSKKRITRR